MPATAALLNRVVAASGSAAAKRAAHHLIQRHQPFVGTPVVLHVTSIHAGRGAHSSSSYTRARRRRRAAPADEGSGQSPAEGSRAAAAQQQQQQQVRQRPSSSSKGALRRLRVLCVSSVRALPAAGLRAAVLGGARRVAALASCTGVSGVLAAGIALSLTSSGVRRWQAGRRAARRGSGFVGAAMAPGTEVTVASFNIRGVMDRWPERAPILRQALKQADADVVCFQEVLTGEFQQEQLLLGSSYRVYECRAALQHLRSASWLGAAASSVVQSLLGVGWVRSLLVSLPESVEAWREKNGLANGWSRLMRDVTIVPFFGNSIASRIPLCAGPAALSSSSSSGGCGSACWPPLWASVGGGKGMSSSSSHGPVSAAAAADVLVLGDFRAAQRVCLQLKLSPAQQQAAGKGQQQQLSDAGATPSSSSSLSQQQQRSDVAQVWLVNTHLDHASPQIRASQMQAICRWVEPLKGRGAAGIIITGDLNAPPDEELHSVAARHGFASTHKAVHGAEPRFTWPSGIIAPLMDVGAPHCADYIYAWQAAGFQLQVLDATLLGDRPADDDATLYPSDHLGLKVTLRISPLQL